MSIHARVMTLHRTHSMAALRVACLLALSFITLPMIAGGCTGAEPRAADVRNDSRTGSIEGGIIHPAHVIPQMRICAIGSGQSAKSVFVRTRHNQTGYRIDGIDPGDYVVISSRSGGSYQIGGHVQQVQCIRAPCPDMLVPLSISPGTHLTGIDINGFYDKRDDFPPMPVSD